MKKLIYLTSFILMVFLGSCSRNTTQFTQIGTLLDLRPLTNDGFFITESNSVGFDYQPIGVMTLLEVSGEDENHVVTKQEVKSDYSDDLYFSAIIKKQSKKWKDADGFSALTELVRLAKEEGANGIINLKIKNNWFMVNNKPQYIISVEVSGMLIKR